MRLRLKRNDKIGLVFFIAFAVSTTLVYQFEERFNPKLWQREPTKRYKLVDDIIDRELLIGKTKEEIIVL